MSDHTFVGTTMEAELEQNGIYASVTRGTSMRPLFKTNRDVVVLRKCDTEPQKYDVVLYKTKDGKYLLHRIIKVRDREFVIRGDNTFVREHIKKDRILAVLTEYNRKGKKHSTDEPGFRVYARIWNFIYPIRFLIHECTSFARKIYHVIFGKRC